MSQPFHYRMNKCQAAAVFRLSCISNSETDTTFFVDHASLPGYDL